MFAGHNESRWCERIARPVRTCGLGGKQPIACAQVAHQNRRDAFVIEELCPLDGELVVPVDQLLDDRPWHRHEQLEHVLWLFRPLQLVQPGDALQRYWLLCFREVGELTL